MDLDTLSFSITKIEFIFMFIGVRFENNEIIYFPVMPIFDLKIIVLESIYFDYLLLEQKQIFALNVK